jgi:hypothetical protein
MMKAFKSYEALSMVKRPRKKAVCFTDIIFPRISQPYMVDKAL